MTNIAICGSFWTWKSTLIKWINHPNKIIDLEREIIWDNKVEDLNQHQVNLWVYQNIIINERRKDNFITNSSLIDNRAYTIKYSPELAKDMEPIIYDKILYLPIEFPLVNDWIRHTVEELREEIDEIIRWLIKNKREVYTIRWTIEERIKLVNDILKWK